MRPKYGTSVFGNHEFLWNAVFRAREHVNKTSGYIIVQPFRLFRVLPVAKLETSEMAAQYLPEILCRRRGLLKLPNEMLKSGCWVNFGVIPFLSRDRSPTVFSDCNCSGWLDYLADLLIRHCTSTEIALVIPLQSFLEKALGTPKKGMGGTFWAKGNALQAHTYVPL